MKNETSKVYTASNHTPVDPVIFDKPVEKKGTNPAIFEVPTKSVEQKTYLVLIKTDDDEMSDGTFKVCKGRTECFRYIEKLCQAYGSDFNVYESIVTTETKQTETKTENIKYFMINLEEAISVYAFCKSVEEFYGSHGFKIDDYFPAPSTDDDESSTTAFIEQGVHKEYSKFIELKEGRMTCDMSTLLTRNNDESVNI